MSTTGFARVSGDDPFNLSIKDAEGLGFRGGSET